MLSNTYTIADSLASNQTWNRTNVKDGLSTYVNDTLRVTGVRRGFTVKSRIGKRTDKSVIPNVTSSYVEWTQVVSAQVSGHAMPVEVSITYRIPESMRNIPATYRAAIKDLKLVTVALSDTDAELDDIADGRTQ
jgi:hypothetical protein